MQTRKYYIESKLGTDNWVRRDFLSFDDASKAIEFRNTLAGDPNAQGSKFRVVLEISLTVIEVICNG